MKKQVFIFVFGMVLCSCSDRVVQPDNEPIFINETNLSIFFLYGSFENGSLFDTLTIESGDTLYSIPGKSFPTLTEELGLISMSDSSPFDVRLVFDTNPLKCLDFQGNIKEKLDIRSFSSYENIGPCYFCANRGLTTPEGMLYRITDELLEQAEPCE